MENNTSAEEKEKKEVMPESPVTMENEKKEDVLSGDSSAKNSESSEKKEPEENKSASSEKKNSDEYWRPRGSFGFGDKDSQNSKDSGKNGFENRNAGNNLSGGKNRIGLFVFFAVAAIFIMSLFTNRASIQEVSYSKFKTLVATGAVGAATIRDGQEIEFVIKDEGNTNLKTRIPYFDPSLLEELRSQDIVVTGAERNTSVISYIIEFLPLIVIGIFTIMLFRQMGSNGQLFQYGKSLAKQYEEKDIKTTFKDVAGQKEAKYELEEVVDFLKNPKAFSEIGAKIPRGVLMVGPPGTGKTLLAKAVAGEAGVSFFHTSGSDFVEMFVGMGASRVRDLFEQGRKHAPCILFIDEIDAVGRSRGSGLGGGHDEREQTLNQILVEMDGFDTASGVIVIAATNRADVLDPALLRPGRFDRQVAITLPDIDEREEILKIHAAKVKMDPAVDLNKIARATPGASGADLANLVNEAALYATRAKRKSVELIDFEEARDKMVLGVARKSHVMTPEDKKLTSYHESGHALLFYYLPDIDPLYKVTIIPHGNAGGVTMGLPEKDESYMKKSTLLSHIKMCMGGYIAEELLNGQTSTGPSADIKQATEIARRMVREFGMSKLGFISLGSEGEPLFLGREIAQHKDFSEETAKMVDSEVSSILSQCMKEARIILTSHRDQLDKLANALIERETMDDNDIRMLLGFEAVEHKNSDFS